MYWIIYAYRIRSGAMQVSLAIHQEWRCPPWRAAQRGASRELLCNADDPQEFIALARFENEDAAWAAIAEPEHHAWYARLVSVAEAGPTVTHYKSPCQNE